MTAETSIGPSDGRLPSSSLWTTIAATSGARFYAMAAGLSTLLLVARWLGPEGRGVVAAVNAWWVLLASLGSLSLGQVIFFKASSARSATWLGPTIASVAAHALLASLVAWSVTGAIFAMESGPLQGLPMAAVAVAAASLPLLIWEQYGSALLTVLDRLRTYNRALVLGRTVTLLGIPVVLVWLGQGVVAVIAVLVIGQLVTAAGGLRAILREARGTVILRASSWAETLRHGLKVHIGALGTAWITSTNILIVQRFLGAAETGQFSIANDILTVMLVVAQAAAAVIYARMSSRGPDAIWPTQRNMLLAITPLMMGVAVVAMVAVPPLISLILGDAFTRAGVLFGVLAWVIVPQTVILVMSPQWVGRGLFLLSGGITIAAGLLNVGLCFALLPRYGSLGAAYSALVANAALMCVNLALGVKLESRYRATRARS